MKTHSFNKNKSMMYSLIYSIIITIIFLLYIKNGNFQLIEKVNEFRAHSFLYKLSYIIILFAVYFILIILHEFIHGFFFAKYCPSGWKDVKFGILPKRLAAYTSCYKPIEVKKLKIVVLMPTILIVPILIFLFFKFNLLIFLVFAYIMMISGACDFIYFLELNKVKNNKLVIDHPNEMGFMIIEKSEDYNLIIKDLLNKKCNSETEKSSSKYAIISFILGIITMLALFKFYK